MAYRLNHENGHGDALLYGPSKDLPSAWSKDQRLDIITSLRQFQPVVEGVYSGPDKDEFHRVRHIARTLVYAACLMDAEDPHVLKIDRSVVYWSLVLHDVRSNHHDVPDHGDDGAAYIAPFVKSSTLFSPAQAENIINNVRWHNKKPGNIPEEYRTAELSVIKDADALDLVRMPGEREIFLTNIEAYNLHPFVLKFYEDTEKMTHGNDFDVIMSAFEQL